MAIIDVIQKKLNVQPTGIPTVVRLSQNENGRELVFDVENCEIPGGSTVTLSGTKPDGVVYSLVGSITDNTVTFDEDIQMTAVGGQWDAKVIIVNGGNTVATGRVRMIIDPDTVDPDAVPSDSQLEGLVAQAQEYAEYAKGAAYGAPYVASTVAEMTDHDHVYVYTGSETGYTAGNWYYWDGSAWTSGGVYNSVAVSTDKSLTVADMAADSKAVGDVFKLFNAADLINSRGMGTSTTSGNITFAFDASENKCAVSGTASSNTFKNIYVNTSALPDGMEAGGTYYVKYSGTNVSFRVYYYLSGQPATELLVTYTDASFTIPALAVGLIMRLYVAKNAVVSETVKYHVLNAYTNHELTEKVDDATAILPVARINGKITSAVDLNDYRTAGQYYVSATSVQNSTNVPADIASSRGAILNVIPATNNSPTDGVIQVIQSVFDMQTFGRRYASGSWTDWVFQYADYKADSETLAEICADFDRKITDNTTRLTRKGGYNLDDVISGLTWEIGNITSAGTETSNTHYIRSNYLRTDAGDQFFTKYDSSSPTYRVRFYFYDANQEYIGYSTTYSAFSGAIDDQAYITVGDGYIRFVVLKTPADTYTISTSDISSVDFNVKRLSFKNAEVIRVASNNVRNWGTEHSYGYTGNYDTNVKFYEKLYASVLPTILGFQEFSPYLDAAHNHPASAFFRGLFTGFYNTTSPRIPIASNLPITELTKYTTSTSRDYAAGKITNANNDEIMLVNIHCYPGTDATAISNRQTEYGELLTFLTGKSFIITGDFNANTISEFNIFKTAGCNLANGGDFGDFVTGENGEPFDNVITSGDLEIVYANIADSAGTSDHKLIYADVVI